MTPKRTHKESAADPQPQTNGEIHEDWNGETAPEDAELAAEGVGAAEAVPMPQDTGSAELEAMRERYLRLAAEFDNYRKRTERERSEAWSRAQAHLVERLLDVVDDLQRVAGLDPERTTVASLLEGVQLVERKLLRALEGAGLETVDAKGKPFDPSLHEALMSTPTSDRERDDTVAEVFQQGYLFKGNLIRPARVQVNKYEG